MKNFKRNNVQVEIYSFLLGRELGFCFVFILLLSFLWLLVYLFVEIESLSQDSLELAIELKLALIELLIFLPSLSKCWVYRCVLTCSVLYTVHRHVCIE